MSSHRLRVAFLGGKPLSARCLAHLHGYHLSGQIDIVAVLARPAGFRGWWSRPDVPEVRETAIALGLPVVQTVEDIVSMPLDLGLSVLYWQRLPGHVLAHAARGFLNLHGAPLPHYRGCNVCSHAILNGETRFAATLHQMDEQIDHGPVIDMEWFGVSPNTTSRQLMQMTELAAERLFVRSLPRVLDNSLAPTSQAVIMKRDGIEPRYYTRSSLDELREIDAQWPDEKIRRHALAFDFPPFAPAFVRIGATSHPLTAASVDAYLQERVRALEACR